jgi:UDP-N-acetylmuramoyl-tripeptide--D-alanyl-D-alanine ligase
MIAALKTLLELPCEGRRLAVLGSMKELGVTLESGHRAVGKQVALSNLDALVLIGEETRYVAEEAIQDGFPAGKIIHADGMDTVTSFLQTIREGDLVLIKGSRALGLEQALPDEVLP